MSDAEHHKPGLAKHIHVTERSVVVDGIDIGNWIARGPIRIVTDENASTAVHVTLVADRVIADINPHPATEPTAFAEPETGWEAYISSRPRPAQDT